MDRISGQYNLPQKEVVLVKETPQKVETGRFKGFTPYGEVLVETSPDKLTAWDRKNTKTIEQILAEKNKKIEIMSAFATIQNKIIDTLTHPPTPGQRNTNKLNYNA